MININIEVENDNLKSIKITGHADYDESGKDIVCSSVSTAIIMTINQLELFEELSNVKYELYEGDFILTIINLNDNIDKITKNLTYTVTSLESQYDKYIKINK